MKKNEQPGLLEKTRMGFAVGPDIEEDEVRERKITRNGKNARTLRQDMRTEAAIRGGKPNLAVEGNHHADQKPRVEDRGQNYRISNPRGPDVEGGLVGGKGYASLQMK